MVGPAEFGRDDLSLCYNRTFEKGEPRVDLQLIVAELEAERERLEEAIAALRGPTGRTPNGRRRRRRLSAAARKRISAAMKARWARRKKIGP